MPGYRVSYRPSGSLRGPGGGLGATAIRAISSPKAAAVQVFNPLYPDLDGFCNVGYGR